MPPMESTGSHVINYSMLIENKTEQECVKYTDLLQTFEQQCQITIHTLLLYMLLVLVPDVITTHQPSLPLVLDEASRPVLQVSFTVLTTGREPALSKQTCTCLL